MKKQIMKRAWEIANQAVKKFGGKAREYFSISLRMAWAEVKTASTVVSGIDVTKLPTLQGTEKQVAWAEDIRKNYIDYINKQLAGESERVTDSNFPINYREAQDVFMGYAGAADSMSTIDTATPYNIKKQQVKKLHPEIATVRELEEKIFQELRDLYDEANEAGKEARTQAKAQGKTKEEVSTASRKAKSKILAPMLKTYFQQSLQNNPRNAKAAAWIHDFKDTKFNTFYQK